MEIYWTVGYPSLLAQLKGGWLRVAAMQYGSNLVDSADDKLTLYFPPLAYHDQKLSPMPEHPEGMSGGGVWRFDKPKSADQVFDAQKHVRLFGIRCAWETESRLFKAVPSAAILDLLKTNYSDLVG